MGFRITTQAIRAMKSGGQRKDHGGLLSQRICQVASRISEVPGVKFRGAERIFN